MRRPFLSLAAAALALVATVAPAAAFTELGSGGTYYVPQVTDESGFPGATCRYANNAGTSNDTLKTLTIRQFFSHAPYAKKANVGFRLTILRNGSPYTTTAMQKAKANQVSVAFFGPISWTKPAGLSGEFQAVIKLTYFNPAGVKKGHYRGIIDVYDNKLVGTSSHYVTGDPGDPGDPTDGNMPGGCVGKFVLN